MKIKLISPLFLLFIITSTFCQSPNWSWIKKISNNIECSTTDEHGNTYTMGQLNGQPATFDSIVLSPSSYYCVYISKHNSSGKIVFAKKIEANFTPCKLVIDNSNNILISGNYSTSVSIGLDTIENTSNNTNQLLIKVDSLGDILWTKNFGSNGIDFNYGLSVDDSNNVYMGGTYGGEQLIFNNDTLSRTIGSDTIECSEVYLVKFNSNGDKIWARAIQGNKNETGGDISIDNDGFINICGTFKSRYLTIGTNTLVNTNNQFYNNPDIFIAKYSVLGTCIWAKKYGGVSDELTPIIKTDTHNNIYLSGVTNSSSIPFELNTNTFTDNDGYNTFITKFNDLGQMQWGRIVKSTAYNQNRDIALDTTGNVYLTGWFSGTFVYGDDTLSVMNSNPAIFICKTDIYGNSQWVKKISGNNDDGSIPYSISLNSDGHIFITGFSIVDTLYFGNRQLVNDECLFDENCPMVFISCLLNTEISNNTPICEGFELQLNTSFIPNATYYWTGPNNFTSNDQNPTLLSATVDMSGAYALHVVAPDMLDIFDTTYVNIYPYPLAPTPTNDGPACAESPFTLLASEMINATYYWTGPDNFSAIGQSPTTTANISGYYYVNVVVNGCPSPVDSTFVTINPIPLAPEISGNNRVCIGSPISLSVNSITGDSCSWVGPNGYSTNDQNPIVSDSAILSMSGYYYASVFENGCSSPSDSIEVIVNQPMENPIICIVGIDSAQQKNMVVWNKIASNAINHYNIYKESSFVNQYELIGVVPYDSLSVFIDTISNPLQSSTKYRISITDSCNTETTLSPEHKTIHLSINQGMGNSFNLIWNNYEGFATSTYNIYRGTSQDNVSLLASLPSSVNSYTDFSPPTGYVYYQIEVLSPSNCSPSKSNNYNSSKSNFASNNPNNISEISYEREIIITPNPADTYLHVAISNYSTTNDYNLKIYSLDGFLLESTPIKNSQNVIDISKLSTGIYFIKVKWSKFVTTKKIIKI